LNPHMNWLRGRDLVQFDEKRREARTKGQIADDGNLLFCSGLHRLFTKEFKALELLNQDY
jgi:hypothetical protein